MAYDDPRKAKEYRQRNRERLRLYNREKRASLTPEERERLLANKRKNYALRKESVCARERARQAAIAPELRVAAKRLKRYGLTQEQYETMMVQQDFLCAICKTKPPATVDHCHETRLVRGLLCHGCNVGLGQLGDSVDGLMRAIEYLRSG